MTHTRTPASLGPIARRVALRAGPLALLGTGLLAAPPPAVILAQSGTASWQTFAGGDEVIALAVNPVDPRQLWAGTEGGGVVVWDLGAKGSFQQHLFPMQPGLGSNTVYDIAFDPHTGEAWLATAAGVTRAAGSPWTAYPVGDDPQADLSLPLPPFTAVAVDGDGRVWAGGPNGLAALEPGSTVWVAYPAVDFVAGDEGPHTGPGETHVADIVIDDAGLVYIAHGGSKNDNKPVLSIFNPAENSWRHISTIAPNDDPTTGPRSNQILALALDDGGTLWLASWGRGVLSWNRQQTWAEYRLADDLCSDQVWAIHTAPGEVWAACDMDRAREGAIARWDGTRWETWDLAGTLASQRVSSLAGGGSEVYLGTNGLGTNSPNSTGGIGILPFDGHQAGEAWRTAPRTPWSNDIRSLAFEADGTLWAGTRDAGLMRYRPRDGVWDVFTVENAPGDLVGNTITDLAIRRQSELWVATLQTKFENGRWVDGGISRYDLAHGRWLPSIRADASSSGAGLPSNHVSSLAIDAGDRVWIGLGDATGGAGVYSGPVHSGEGVAVYEPDRGDWEYYSYDQSLAGATVIDLASAGDKILVASSYDAQAAGRTETWTGGGVSRFAGGLWSRWSGAPSDTSGFRTYHGSGDANDKSGLVTGDVRSVALDRDGSAWAGTYSLDDGPLLSKWPFVDAVVNHQRGDDTWENEAFARQGWVSAIAQDSLGQLWVGTTRGHFMNSDAFQEFALDRNQRYDREGGNSDGKAVGGVRVRTSGGWVELSPRTSGLAAYAITALALDPATQAIWVGSENGGLSVYRATQLQPTPTPGTPTAPPAATATAIAPTVGAGTIPVVRTLPPRHTQPPPGEPTEIGGDGDEPEPPPEVPEASTLALLAAGLAGLAGWVGLRRRRSD